AWSTLPWGEIATGAAPSWPVVAGPSVLLPQPSTQPRRAHQRWIEPLTRLAYVPAPEARQSGAAALCFPAMADPMAVQMAQLLANSDLDELREVVKRWIAEAPTGGSRKT